MGGEDTHEIVRERDAEAAREASAGERPGIVGGCGEGGVTNVEFLKGRIKQIPLPAETVDVIISNCVVNLSPDKAAVGALPAAPTRESRPGCC